MDALSTFEAIEDDESFWEFVRSRLSFILSRIGRGHRAIHVAPTIAPFRPSRLGHMHDHPEVTLGAVGDGFMRLTEGDVPIRPDAVTIMPRGVPHLEHGLDGQGIYANICYNVLPDTYGGHAFMLIEGRRVVKHAARFADSRAARSRRYLIDACAAVGLGGAPCGHLARGLAQASLALMLEAIEGRESFEVEDQLVHMSRMFIDSHLSDPDLSVARVAQVLGYSADYLSNRFHAVTGVRLSALITKERMALATRLLPDETLNISEVARACGYEDPAYFSRVFRVGHGQSPRSWRIAHPHPNGPN